VEVVICGWEGNCGHCREYWHLLPVYDSIMHIGEVSLRVWDGWMFHGYAVLVYKL